MRLARRITLLCMLCTVPFLNAQTAVIRWYLSTDGLQDPAGDPNDPNNGSVAPANYPTAINPVVDASAGARLYLWASNPVPNRVWNAFQNYAFQIVNGDAVITSVVIYNHLLDPEYTPDDPDDNERWAAVSSGSGAGTQSATGVTMFFVSGHPGLRNFTPDVVALDSHYVESHGMSTLIGHLTVQGTMGEVFIRPGLSSVKTSTGGGIPIGNVTVLKGFGDDPFVELPDAFIAAAPLCTCDANCDGNTDILDINAFVLAIESQAAWQAQYTCNYLCANDVNDDNAVDVLDINAFVTCIAGL